MSFEESIPACCRKGGTVRNATPSRRTPNARSSLAEESQIREYNLDETNTDLLDLDLSSIHEDDPEDPPLPPPRATYGRSGSYTEELDEETPMLNTKANNVAHHVPIRPRTPTPSPKRPSSGKQSPKPACCRGGKALEGRKMFDETITKSPFPPRQPRRPVDEAAKTAKILSGSYVEEMDEPQESYSSVARAADQVPPKSIRNQYKATPTEYDPLPPPKRTRGMTRSFYEEVKEQVMARRAAAAAPRIPKDYAPPQPPKGTQDPSRSFRTEDQAHVARSLPEDTRYKYQSVATDYARPPPPKQTEQTYTESPRLEGTRYKYQPLATDYAPLPPPEQTKGMSESFYEETVARRAAPVLPPRTNVNQRRMSPTRTPKTHVPPSSRNYSTYDQSDSGYHEYSYVSKSSKTPQVETLYEQTPRSPQRPPSPRQMQRSIWEEPAYRTQLGPSQSPRRLQAQDYADSTQRYPDRTLIPRRTTPRPDSRSPQQLQMPQQSRPTPAYSSQRSEGVWPPRQAVPRSTSPQTRPTTPQMRPTTPQTRPTTPQTRPATPQIRPTTPLTRPTTPRSAWTPSMQRPQSAVEPVYPRYDSGRPRTADAALERVTRPKYGEYETNRFQYPARGAIRGAQDFQTLLELRTPRTLDSNVPLHLSINITCPRGFNIDGFDKRYVEYNPNLQSYSMPP